MTVQQMMKLSDDELRKLSIDELKKWRDTYKHFISTKEFANRCDMIIKINGENQ